MFIYAYGVITSTRLNIFTLFRHLQRHSKTFFGGEIKAANRKIWGKVKFDIRSSMNIDNRNCFIM